jgi:hypothetical protein
MILMLTKITRVSVYSSPRAEVLEMDLRDSLLQGSVPLEGGTPGDDLLPGGDFNL